MLVNYGKHVAPVPINNYNDDNDDDYVDDDEKNCRWKVLTCWYC